MNWDLPIIPHHSLSSAIISDIVIVAKLITYGGCCIAIKTIITNGSPFSIAIHLHQSIGYMGRSIETNLARVWIVPDPSGIYNSNTQKNLAKLAL